MTIYLYGKRYFLLWTDLKGQWLTQIGKFTHRWICNVPSYLLVFAAKLYHNQERGGARSLAPPPPRRVPWYGEKEVQARVKILIEIITIFPSYFNNNTNIHAIGTPFYAEWTLFHLISACRNWFLTLLLVLNRELHDARVCDKTHHSLTRVIWFNNGIRFR